ncbi:hypothetical protein BU17DRAFT_64163 [Hysterangium stoloniferum]|nr:hypothetical protein BU17DRAFT_64163 [Hysterangium stoloniferum]
MAIPFDDIKLLSTDYAPMSSEAAEIRSLATIRHSELSSLNDAIRALESQLLAFKAKRVEVETSLTVANALLAPIRRIPIEILQEIFVQAIPAFRENIDPSSDDSLPWDFDEHHPQKVRASIVLVCRRWKVVAENTPRVWTTIALDYRLPSDMRIVERWFAQTRQRPLDVYVRPSVWYNIDYDFTHAMITLLEGHVSRMRMFIADMGHYYLPAPSIARMFFPSPGERSEFPNLEVFVIIGGNVGDLSEIVGMVHAPRLTSLVLGSQSNFWLENITNDTLASIKWLTISFRNGPADWHLDRLAFCRNLRVLHWADRAPRIVPLRAPVTTTLSLPSLQYLHLSDGIPSDFIPLFGLINMPAVQLVAFRAPAFSHHQFPPVLDSLNVFLERSSLKLTTLKLKDISMIADATRLRQTFLGLPQLISLEISKCRLDTHFFRHTLSSTCPNLERVVVEHTTFSVEDLVYFMDTRIRGRTGISVQLTVLEENSENNALVLDRRDVMSLNQLEREYKHAIRIYWCN